MVRNYTSIQVSNETKTRLKTLSLTPRESYENILIRLLDAKLHGREIKYQISTIDGEYCIDCVVDWGKDKENIMFFDMDGDRKFELPTYTCDDESIQKEWNEFIEAIKDMTNLVRNLSVLEYGEEIRAGNLLLKYIG